MSTDRTSLQTRGSPGGTPSAEELVETLRASPLTILVGAPGSGKTQLLRGGVLGLLRRRTDDLAIAAPASSDPPALADERRRRTVRPRELVVYCDQWSGSPAAQVHACLDEAAGIAADTSGAARLPVALRAKALSAQRGSRLLFVFDQGDRIAAAAAGGDVDAAAEYDALVNALCSVSPSVHLLLSARDDALPPSVLSRLASPDTRVVRLPDPSAPAPVAAVPTVSVAGTPRPLLATDRSSRPEDADAPTHEANSPVPDDAVTALPGAAAADGPASGPTLGDRGSNALPGGVGRPAAVSWPAAPGPRPSARATGAAGMRAPAAALLAVIVLVAGIGAWLRQERAATGAALERRSGAGVGVGDGRARAAGGRSATPAAATVPPRTAPAASGRPGDGAPSRLAGVTEEAGTEAPLADELWRQMARHGVARVGAAGEPPGGGLGLAVVAYDTLRTLASAPVTAQTARVVAPLFTEELHVIVRADSPLRFIHEIAGRRVDFGPVGSARNLTAIAFYKRLFDRPPGRAETSTADLDAALDELLDGGSVDAIVLPEPQPSAWLARLPAARSRQLKLLAAAPGDPSTRRAQRSYLPAMVLPPAGMAATPVRSFAVLTFLIANPAAAAGRDDGPAVAAQALCASLPELRRNGHPKWREVDPALTVPVPLAFDPQAAKVDSACGAGREAPDERPPITVSDAGNDNPSRGEKR